MLIVIKVHINGIPINVIEEINKQLKLLFACIPPEKDLNKA